MARPRSSTTEFAEIDGAITFALTLGYRATIDAGDAWVLKDKWSAYQAQSNVYACTQRNGRRIMLHKEIVKPPRGALIDHFNGDTMDNRRWNLRLCSNADNILNVSRPENSGVRWDRARRRWYARITWRGKDYFIGRFFDHMEAVLATQTTRQRLMDEDPYFQGETGATDHTLLRSLPVRGGTLA